MHDLIIRGGTIVDGSGGEPFVGDVAIDGDRIVAVGQAAGAAKREIDARGLMVTPGFVDIHTHYDGQATWDPLLAPSSWHGVTTAVMGNCGVGFAPVRPGDHQFLIDLMEGVEDIPGSALAEGIDWKWERFPEYLDALEAMPRAIDVGAQVPHAAVRAYVLGERCNTDYAPNAGEIAQMAELVREGVAAGALGFSTSRTLLHRDLKGVHMPGTFAGSDEMLALGMAMKGLTHGVYELVSDHLGDDDEWAWVKSFAKESGLPVTMVATSAGAYEGNKMYNIAEEARAEGMEIRPQIAGRPTGILHGLTSSSTCSPPARPGGASWPVCRWRKSSPRCSGRRSARPCWARAASPATARSAATRTNSSTASSRSASGRTTSRTAPPASAAWLRRRA